MNMMKDILDKTELNSVSVDDVPGEYWFEDRSGEPLETSPTPGIHHSLKLLFKRKHGNWGNWAENAV